MSIKGFSIDASLDYKYLYFSQFTIMLGWYLQPRGQSSTDRGPADSSGRSRQNIDREAIKGEKKVWNFRSFSQSGPSIISIYYLLDSKNHLL